ncbi:MAG: two-component system sensor histidine kinase ZraS [Desulfovibrio sp.]|nr:two-component system sensor histidine kinase ZraS [Desulfovibrio sp.]
MDTQPSRPGSGPDSSPAAAPSPPVQAGQTNQAGQTSQTGAEAARAQEACAGAADRKGLGKGPVMRKVRKVRRAGYLGELFGPENISHIPLGFLLTLAGITLVLMVSLPAFISVQRNEETLAHLLADKGSSLIMAFENILRTGMRSQAGVRLQILLEEMASAPDIAFVAVAMPDGTIIAHSDRRRLGEVLSIDGREADEAAVAALAPSRSVQWSIMQMEGTRSFVAYRQFLPGPQQARRPSNLPIPAIYLGLDVSPFEVTKSQNRAYVFMLAGATLLLGLACLIALFFAERARQSRSREQEAEGRVRALEEEVRRKEKLAAVGSLAAGVAHEIRNPLSSIKGYATYFGMRFPEGSEDRKAAGVMVAEVERLNRVITELIGLSRPTDAALRPVRLDTVLDHVTSLILRDAETRRVKVVIRLPRKAPLAMADPDRLGQALLNLCLNALEAMPPSGGRLTLAAAQAGGRAIITVKDNGTGIAPEHLSRIFDPYFTTKAKGTGIGLATVHKIVEALHGEITVASRPSEGKRQGETVFTISLPLADAAGAGPAGEDFSAKSAYTGSPDRTPHASALQDSSARQAQGRPRACPPDRDSQDEAPHDSKEQRTDS